MSSILNSILSGDLQVQQAPEVKPVKEDSVIDLLQNSEIEFELQNKAEPEPPKVILEDISTDLFLNKKEPVEQEDSISDLLQNSEIEFTTCPKLEDKLENVNTGFGENNDLHIEDLCIKPKLKKPLYYDNYLSEFITEEEKAAARHALGIYNKGDVVAMSLLTAEDKIPSDKEVEEATIQQLRKGDKFFNPYTSFTAVLDSDGKTLTHRIYEINQLIIQQQKEITKINTVSGNTTITSLGDVRVFLQGFNSGENLHTTLDSMNQQMLRFQKTGDIN